LSYITSLRRILGSKDQKLYGRLLNIEKKAESLLTYTAGKFPYYTPHDFVTHSRNVEENLNWIIDDEVKATFNPHEAFFLLVASWLHDWGMIGQAHEDPKEVREVHNLRTEAYLEKFHEKMFLSQHEARIIGKICRGHTNEDIRDEYYDDMIFGANVPVRIRFITACLRIADECDVASNRTPEIIYYSLNPTDEAEEEFEKHLAISGIGRPQAEKHKIQLFGIAWDPKGVRALEKVRDKIQKELDNVKLFLAQQGVVIDYVELRIDTRGFINKPIEFVLDRQKIVELLMGSHLYKRKDSAVRELLQNAVDTCRLRKVLQEEYTPAIRVQLGKEKFSIDDNGLGMNFEDASDFLSRKGSSFYVSENLGKMLGDKEFVPISKFGIGILSCFLIASKVVFESKKPGFGACRFIIEDISKGWRYEEGSRRTEGTEVTLFLNEEGKRIDVEEALRHYAKVIEIPMILLDEETGESPILQQEWSPSMTEIKEAVIQVRADRMAEPKISDEILLDQTVRTDGIEATYFFLKRESRFYVTSDNCFLAYKGIYVGEFSFFPRHMPNRWFVLMNCTKDMIDIAVSREDLVENEKNKEFIRLVHKNFLRFIEVTTNKEDFIQHSKALHQYLDDHVRAPMADVRAELIYGIELGRTYPVLDQKGVRFMRGEEILLSKSTEKIYQYLMPLAGCKHHIESVAPYLKTWIEEKDLVVFDVGPHFCLSSEEGPSQLAISVLCKENSIDHEHLDLLKFLRTIPLEKIDTPLSSLLPAGSSFVEMPEEFRGFFLYKKPYRFVSVDENIAVDFLIYRRLLGKCLFASEPAIAGLYDQELERYVGTSFEKVQDGEFLFDKNDSFMRLLIESTGKIEADEMLKSLVHIYFTYLALFAVEFPRDESDWGPLWIIEKTILKALGCQAKYRDLFERMGKMAGVLCECDQIPYELIHGWMYRP